MPPKKPSKKVGVQQLACPTRYPCNLNIHIFLLSEYFSFMNKLLSTRNVEQSSIERWGKVRRYEDKWGYINEDRRRHRGHILIPIKRVSYFSSSAGGRTGQAWQPSLVSPFYSRATQKIRGQIRTFEDKWGDKSIDEDKWGQKWGDMITDKDKCRIILLPIKRASWCRSKEAGQVKPGTQHLPSFRLSTPVPEPYTSSSFCSCCGQLLLSNANSVQKMHLQTVSFQLLMYGPYIVRRTILSRKCSWKRKRKISSVFCKKVFGELNSIRRIHSLLKADIKKRLTAQIQLIP